MILSILAELCLAGAALWAMRRVPPAAGAGFLLFAAAAIAGALTYGGVGLAAAPHDFLSKMANWGALALIALGRAQRPVVIAITGVALLAVAVATGQTVPINIAALMLLVCGVWWQSKRPPAYLMLGALLFALAGLVIGTHGQMRTDLFHATLAVAVFLLGF